MSERSADIRVVRGAPTDEELAAAIAVVQAALAAAEEAATKGAKSGSTRSSWNRNHGMLRSPLQVGPGQWSSSFMNGLN